jgi:chaperonin cofactor prefoldin
LSEEYQKLKESYDAMLNEKKEYSSQLELLNETIKEYEALIANKVFELLVHKCMDRFYE